LFIDQRIDLLIAVVGVIALCTAREVLVELRVGIIDLALGDVHCDAVILAHHHRIPLGGVERVELAVDVDLLQLVYQDHCRIAVIRNIARRNLDREPVVGTIAGDASADSIAAKRLAAAANTLQLAFIQFTSRCVTIGSSSQPATVLVALIWPIANCRASEVSINPRWACNPG